MRTDRWQQIDRIYHSALERPSSERTAFVALACAGDESLCHEVLSLLAYETGAAAFLERPALDEAARAIAGDSDRLVGQEVGGYRIDALLGYGGMGEVYRARDLRLRRDVALKVVAAALDGDHAYVRRLEEEARSASGLNHPNIVTIYGVGEHEGMAFIAMELVQGRTLRQVLDGGAVPLAEAWTMALQLGEALAAAHAAGIVHRDLKPDNLMITPDGLLKVLDFGIARRAEAPLGLTALSSDAQTGLTSDGAIIGTAGYMSPEQAAGKPADRASDQFSFAAILYEILTARRAFAGPTRHDTIAAILTCDPQPIEQINPAVPASLRRVIARALSKSAAARYADTRDMVNDLRRGRDEWLRAQSGVVTRRQAIGALAAVVVSVAGGAAAWTRAFGDRGIRAVAVLPFLNAARDSDADYVCDGLTEGLIRRLSLPSLKVAARSAVFNFKGAAMDAVSAGRRLRADAVLAGSVQRLDGRLQIAATLVETASGASLWSATYTGSAGDVLFIEQEILRGVLDQGIRFKPGEADRRELARATTANPAAYDLYLRGLNVFRRDSEADYLSAQHLLRDAIAKDSTFADAYAALAATYSVLAVDGYMRPNEAWAGSFSNAQRAIALDRDAPTAHAELGAGFFAFVRDFPTAEREWETARQSRDGRYEPDFLIAYALERWATGRPQAAIALARQARELDPIGTPWRLRLADFLLADQKVEQAVSEYEALTRDLPDDARAYFGLAEARRRQGRFDDAITALAAGHAAAGNPALQAVLAMATGEAGLQRVERITAQLTLQQLKAREADGRYVSPLDFGRVYAQLGDVRQALACFPAAFDERSPGLVFLNVDRAWDRVRSEPVFREAVRRVGLAA